MRKTAVIIGAGPAGLTAAFELLTRSDIRVVVLENSTYMGGISRTVNYKGNRIDIGGHRFFSKSDRVMDWWLQHMPMADGTTGSAQITYQNQTRSLPHNAPVSSDDAVMLLRSRKSRIYFLRKFFEYPITLSADTLRNLGLVRTLKIGFSYLWTAMFPPKQVDNLEQFFIARFGNELYRTFFKSYTEKVWGVACDQISAEWGAQRIKGLSITKTILHILKKTFAPKKKDIKQKDMETSLIEQFMYPKLGPGQLWEIVADKVRALGGEILTEFNVTGIRTAGSKVVGITGVDATGQQREFVGDYFFSTMPVKELINSLDAQVPTDVRAISDGLLYRDFITVGLLCKKLKVRDPRDPNQLVKDNWIYIQEPDVTIGRLQIFNNWSPYLVKDHDTVWIGCEYFCYDTDEMWKLPDAEMSAMAKQELEKIGIISQQDVLDSTVIRMEKTYPAYFGTYDRFPEIRTYVDSFENLFLVGRNGMHRYNNQDHSMLTAMTAVDNILEGRVDKTNIWDVNTEAEYHETKEDAAKTEPAEAPEPQSASS